MSVGGEGPSPCARMVCGEAPGRTEVDQGRPFVGRSGELLENLLAEFGFARDDVYITNVCKEIPLDVDGKIRVPFRGECDRWRPILELEMRAVQPDAVLLLGRTAYWVLSGDWDETQPTPWGVAWKHSGVLYVPVWHPAYLLRGGGFFDEWVAQARPWAEAVS